MKGLIVILMGLCLWAPFAQAQGINDEFMRLQMALESKPNDLGLLKELAILYSQGLQWERAANTYDKILTLNPKDPFALSERCVCYTEALLKDKAVESCEAFAKLNQNSVLAVDNLGLMYFRFRDYAKALQAFSQAAQIDPSSALVRVHKAQVAMAYQEWEYALEILNNINGLNTSPSEKVLIAHAKAVIYDKLKRYDLAYDFMSEAYDLSQNPLFLTKLGKAFVKRYQLGAYIVVTSLLLWFCWYMGIRLNRFLKNED